MILSHVFHRFMSTQINDDDDNKMEVTISTQDTETPYISSLFIERSIANARAQTHSHSILVRVRVFVHLAHTHTHTCRFINFRAQSKTFSEYFNNVI